MTITELTNLADAVTDYLHPDPSSLWLGMFGAI